MTTPSPPNTLLTAQTLLNLNASTPAPPQQKNDALPGSGAGGLVWKVLVLDEMSKDVLATTLRVQDLRDQGVTLHMWAGLPLFLDLVWLPREGGLGGIWLSGEGGADAA
jgi:hypothetical protein